MFYIVGLGNPGEEYANTRHNAGREAVEKLLKDLKKEKFDDFEYHKKANAQVAEGKIGKEKATLILPDTFMNRSGAAVSYFVKPKSGKDKSQPHLIVVHDDLDLALGKLKLSYNKGVGGHRGLDSVVKVVKTLGFVRVRIGVSPSTPKGIVKKPGGNLSPKAAEKAVIDFILGKWKPKEADLIKKSFKRASEAIQTVITEGRDRAMNEFNQN